ncbi:hypothetical protein [Yoonia sp.]|uniref:hypothetical protein n=1 Tax=Yoonia sp. TaxID=2212373 RepID=UPI0035C8455F
MNNNIGVVLASVATLLIIVAFETDGFSKFIKSKSCKDLEADSVMAEVSDFMDGKLKYPGSAVYPQTSRFDFISYGDDPKRCNYILNGFVDAQNGFGALGRVNFTSSGTYNLENPSTLNASTRVVDEHFSFFD